MSEKETAVKALGDSALRQRRTANRTPKPAVQWEYVECGGGGGAVPGCDTQTHKHRQEAAFGPGTTRRVNVRAR